MKIAQSTDKPELWDLTCESCGYHIRTIDGFVLNNVRGHEEHCQNGNKERREVEPPLHMIYRPFGENKDTLSEGESVEDERTETVASSPSESAIQTRELKTYQSGMVRDTDADKVNYALLHDGPMLRRWAEHLSNAARTRGKRNWMNARTPEDLERCRESFSRHYHQYMAGELDEDHMAALFCNGNFMEYIRPRILTEND